eukprot:847944-Pelagomonas_calceolata.AAC.1
MEVIPHPHRIKGLFINLGEAGCTIGGNISPRPLGLTCSCKYWEGGGGRWRGKVEGEGGIEHRAQPPSCYGAL